MDAAPVRYGGVLAEVDHAGVPPNPFALESTQASEATEQALGLPSCPPKTINQLRAGS
jgi:hypothetical protein